MLHKSPNPDVSDTGDAATYAWGGKWRRPTHDEMQYLKTNCTWNWTGSGLLLDSDDREQHNQLCTAFRFFFQYD